MDTKPIYINLLTREHEQGRKVSSTLLACLGLMILIAGLGFWYIHLQDEISSLRAANAKLNKELGQYKDEQLGLNSYRELQSKIEAKEERVNKVSQAQIKCVQVYEGIEQALPEDLVASSVEISGQKALLNGYAGDYHILATFMSGLRKSPIFKNITLISSNIDDDSGEVVFKLELGWEVAHK